MTPRKRWQQARSQVSSAHLRPGYRRPYKACKPEGEAVLNNDVRVMMLAGLRAFGDATCACGFVLCAKRGPCAPVSAPAPSPVPAPVGERKRFEVGQRVRYVHEAARARYGEGVIERIDADGDIVWTDALGTGRSSLPSSLEHVPDPALPSADPVEGWVLPSDWTFARPFDGRAQWTHETGAAAWMMDCGPTWFWAAEDQDFASHDDRSTTLAQACCAALGITLHDNADQMDRDPWEARIDGEPPECGRDIEECARAALEAHARQGGDR